MHQVQDNAEVHNNSSLSVPRLGVVLHPKVLIFNTVKIYFSLKQVMSPNQAAISNCNVLLLLVTYKNSITFPIGSDYYPT